MKAALLDIDGTLVDTNYHHALAWSRAFGRHGLTPPLWRIHRAIGMGGDLLVAAVCSDDAESEHGDDIRAAEGELYAELIGEVRPLDGARDLVVDLSEAGLQVVLASSAKPDEVEHYVELLGVADRITGVTDAGDVDATKPQPDLVEAALERAGVDAADAIFVGDSRWDCEAAGRAGVEVVAILTGGYSEAELRDAGAADVYDTLAPVASRLT